MQLLHRLLCCTGLRLMWAASCMSLLLRCLCLSPCCVCLRLLPRCLNLHPRCLNLRLQLRMCRREGCSCVCYMKMCADIASKPAIGRLRRRNATCSELSDKLYSNGVHCSRQQADESE